MDNKSKTILGLLRIGMGWIFLWAFVDKLLGLGFATAPEKSWLAGGSPTTGFLKFAAKGPFVEIFHAMAGNPIVDWLFMLGLLLIGLALLLGIGVRIAGYSGALLMLFMYLASIQPENNPLLDDHIIYGLLLLLFAATGAGKCLGFGNAWARTSLVQKNPILE
ncbi:MAG: hypothetical protein AAB594_02460 [Patescibacteria group bacterium]